MLFFLSALVPFCNDIMKKRKKNGSSSFSFFSFAFSMLSIVE